RPSQRQIVEAVVALKGPSNQQATLGAVARALTLDKSTVSRRVKVAVADGYLQNLETRRNQPMKLVSGDPLPEIRPLLPEPASLDPNCTVAPLEGGSTSPPPLEVEPPLDRKPHLLALMPNTRPEWEH